MKKCNVGGQAVLEGVMMKSPDAIAIAVRREDGEIVTRYQQYEAPSKRHKWMGWPVIRGIVNFVDMLKIGVSTISYSAEVLGINEEKPNKAEEYVAKKTGKKADDIMMFFTVLVSIALTVGLFFILPTLLAKPLSGMVENVVLKNLIEGCIRLIIFLLYVVAISAMKDIRRVYMYHGAEHKVIACFEHEEELTPQNAIKHKRLHPRCGTNYLLLVMAVSILVFSFLGWSDNFLIRILLRLALLPVVAGLAYEVLKLAAKTDNVLARVVRFPGLMLQKLTTREPDEQMLEVAILSFKLAMYGEQQPVEAEKPKEDTETHQMVETKEAGL